MDKTEKLLKQNNLQGWHYNKGRFTRSIFRLLLLALHSEQKKKTSRKIKCPLP